MSLDPRTVPANVNLVGLRDVALAELADVEAEKEKAEGDGCLS